MGRSHNGISVVIGSQYTTLRGLLLGTITVSCDFWCLHTQPLSWLSLPFPGTLPGEPTSPTLTQLTTTTFRVSWGAPTTGGTVTGYRVFYAIDGYMGNVTLGASKLEWALTLIENQSYVMTIDVQSLSEFFSSPKANVMIPQGKTLQ